MKLSLLFLAVPFLLSSTLIAAETEALVNENNNHAINDTPKINSLPKGCSLTSYTKDGSHLLFKCEGADVATAIFFPNETDGQEINEDIIVQRLTTIANCKDAGKSSIGHVVSCTQNNEVYETYIKTTPSRLIETITTTPQYNTHSNLETLQNFGIITYFYMRKIGRNYDEIDYIESILKNATTMHN